MVAFIPDLKHGIFRFFRMKNRIIRFLCEWGLLKFPIRIGELVTVIPNNAHYKQIFSDTYIETVKATKDFPGNAVVVYIGNHFHEMAFCRVYYRGRIIRSTVRFEVFNFQINLPHKI